MNRIIMQRIMKKLIILPFALSVVVVDFNGCWRPVTKALDEVGIDVSVEGDDIYVDLGGSDEHHHDDHD